VSLTISGSAGGPLDAAKAQDAFRRFVRALDKATVEGGALFIATFAGYEGNDGFNLTADEVRVEDSDKERTAAADAEFEERAKAEVEA
jgi:hypothetical protein